MENIYNEERECVYKNEVYSVRDNGAVKRHLREGKKIRKDDGVWTFGVKNVKNGYMYIGTHRIHIIVATAFYGQRDSKKYVVDHIDTNRCNNRVENLLWVTRLENALLNPDTLKRITMLCDGDIMKFIKDPSCLHDKTGVNQDIMWMRTVTSDEALIAYENIQRLSNLYWEKRICNKDSINENDWHFRKHNYSTTSYIPPQFVKAKSPDTALQKDWKIPVDFICCPSEISNDPLNDYYGRLNVGVDYISASYGYSEDPIVQIVIDRTFVENNKAILVMSHSDDKDSVKPYALSKIWYLGEEFIHENLGTFFEENGARKKFALEQGLEWMGGDSIDNYL